MAEDIRKDGLKRLGILRGEGVRLIAVDIEYPQQHTGPVEHRQYQFGTRRGRTSNVVGKGIDIWHKLHLPCARRRTANTA
jgi:hypothetical protein